MSVEIKVPVLPESVADAIVAKWYKKEGDFVERDENLVDLETDKVMLEVPAPQAGVIEKLMAKEGDTVVAEQSIAFIKEGEKSEAPQEKTQTPKETAKLQEKADERKQKPEHKQSDLSPSVRRLSAEQEIDTTKVEGSGKGGRITKQDLQKIMQQTETLVHQAVELTGSRTEEKVPMSRLRARIAQRLLQVQQEAAILTTFNEINMKPVMDLRSKYKDQFEKTHGTRLGFMSFFTKAVIEALQRFPVVNASIDGNDLIYHNFCDIGIAVGSSRGLVVPILRNAENMPMSEIEKQIRQFAVKAESGKLTIEDMTGGTFTITNGGTYGSMLSTPIINPPQTAILGMHNIVERPVAENGAVVIRPMMYVALSYDHRVIDGREAVLFLRTIKELLEDPARLLLGV